MLWGNDKWIAQEPLTRLSPTSIAQVAQAARLREMASLTPIQDGDSALDGFPPAILRALRRAIKHTSTYPRNSGRPSRYGWSQFQCLPLALKFRKEKSGVTNPPGATPGKRKRA